MLNCVCVCVCRADGVADIIRYVSSVHTTTSSVPPDENVGHYAPSRCNCEKFAAMDTFRRLPVGWSEKWVPLVWSHSFGLTLLVLVVWSEWCSPSRLVSVVYSARSVVPPVWAEQCGLNGVVLGHSSVVARVYSWHRIPVLGY